MAASKINANWSGVAHNAVTITKVTAVTVSQGGAIQEFAGDTDRFGRGLHTRGRQSKAAGIGHAGGGEGVRVAGISVHRSDALRSQAADRVYIEVDHRRLDLVFS